MLPINFPSEHSSDLDKKDLCCLFISFLFLIHTLSIAVVMYEAIAIPVIVVSIFKITKAGFACKNVCCCVVASFLLEYWIGSDYIGLGFTILFLTFASLILLVFSLPLYLFS